MKARVCPSCGKAHDRADLSGCCSRGCLRYHKRRSAPPVARRPKPSPLARELVAAVLETPVVTVTAPPPVDMIQCDVCQTAAPDWCTFEIDGRRVCCNCRPAFVAGQKARDDRAQPEAPSMGGGVRVIRSTKGLA